MDTKDSSLIGYPTYQESPFACIGLQVRKRKRKGTEEPVVGTRTGLMYGTINPIEDIEDYEVDVLPYRKIFVNVIDDLRDFNAPGLKIFCYILLHLKEGMIDILLPPKQVMQYANWKTTVPYYRGLTELLAKDIIARQVGSTARYFINVNKFFNGDRRKL